MQRTAYGNSHEPMFTAVAIATLALGVGGITAMFSAFDISLLRPLPYADADRLVVVWDDMTAQNLPKHPPTPFEWIQGRRFNTVFSDVAATQPAAAQRGWALTFAGLAIGLVLAAIAARSLTSLLYGFQPHYVPAAATVSLILLAVAALACFIPARRASRIDPVIALRNE